MDVRIKTLKYLEMAETNRVNLKEVERPAFMCIFKKSASLAQDEGSLA